MLAAAAGDAEQQLLRGVLELRGARWSKGWRGGVEEIVAKSFATTGAFMYTMVTGYRVLMTAL